MKPDLIDLSVLLQEETGKAFLVSSDGRHQSAVRIKAEREVSGNGAVWTLTLPERVAIEKGLV